MNKTELTKAFAEKSGLSVKEAGEKLQLVNDIIFEALKAGDKVTLFDLGKLEVVDVKEREALKNPKQPELGKKVVPAHKKAKYSASSKVKEAVK